MFELVLARCGRVKRLTAPAEPEVSQRFRSVVRGLVHGRRLRTDDVDVVHVELSGRSLYEFYFCSALVYRKQRPALVVTCHDAPSIAGSVCLVTALDRRGLRRLGVALSSTLGSHLERRVLTRAAAVMALTVEGANELAHRYSRVVEAVPHVTTRSTRDVSKERLAFIPGYVSRPDIVAEVIEGLIRPPGENPQPWRVLVGACDVPVQAEIERRVGHTEAGQVCFTGSLDESALLATFDRATLVIRVAGSGSDNGLAASGPLSIAAARGCVVITDDRRAGARELAEQGLVRLTDDVVSAVHDLVRDWRTTPQEQRLSDLADATSGVASVAAIYRARVLSRLQSRPAVEEWD
jgi:hypothetical protein